MFFQDNLYFAFTLNLQKKNLYEALRTIPEQATFHLKVAIESSWCTKIPQFSSTLNLNPILLYSIKDNTCTFGISLTSETLTLTFPRPHLPRRVSAHSGSGRIPGYGQHPPPSPSPHGAHGTTVLASHPMTPGRRGFGSTAAATIHLGLDLFTDNSGIDLWQRDVLSEVVNQGYVKTQILQELPCNRDVRIDYNYPNSMMLSEGCR